MAVYNAIVKRIRGEATDATALAIQAYIEALDSTNDVLISVNIVGDNNFITCFITHNTT